MEYALRLTVLVGCLTLVFAGPAHSVSAETGLEIGSVVIQGKPLQTWIEQAKTATDLETTVAALSAAVRNDDPKVKVAAADALATLGDRAKAALPALLDQYAHPFPWVRVSCQAACAAMGKEAVPAVIEKFEQSSGGPRIRAAFVLAAIGPEAKAAVPVIQRIMQQESPALQVRYRGILRQIDPEQFSVAEAPTTGAEFEPVQADRARRFHSREWAQFHGPGRDAISREEGLLQEWPDEGPNLLWTLSGLGRGYSSVAIAQGKLYTMGDHSEDGSEAQYVLAFDLNNRQELWAAQIGPPHADGGPRSTPTVDGGRVFALGTDGDLVCLDADSGDRIWQVNVAKKFDGEVMAVWKYSESPLVDGNRVVCTPGGPDATMVALDRETGSVLWKCKIPDLGENGVDAAGYASAVVAEIDGVRQYIQFVGRGVIGVEAETGRFLWGYNRVANNTANITSPTVLGNYVFASAAYNTGSALIKVEREGDTFEAEEVYFLPSRRFQNHHGGVVLIGDYLYGGHGQNRGDPCCVEFGTGKVVWRERAPARGSAAVLYADGHVIFRYDRGDLLLVEATPEGLSIKGRFKAPEGEGPAWAHPVIHQGKLYLRHADLLLCYDIRDL